MSGSKTDKFFNYLASKLGGSALSPGQSFGGPPYQNGSFQYGAPQYSAPAFDPQQYLNSLGTQHSAATATGHARQHNGDHFQGDDNRTHASDQARMYNGDVYNANTYIYYQREAYEAGREQQTSSAPPQANATSFPPPPGYAQPSRPDLPPRQESAPTQQTQPPDWSNVVHLASCDNCGNNPIRGLRWKCLSCPDHDVCNDCKNSGGDEGHSFRSLPSHSNRPLHLASLGRAAAEGSTYGVISALSPGCMIELCDHPRQDPLVLAARAGHFQVCQALFEKLGPVYSPQIVTTAIRAAKTAPGYMGPLLAQYLESQAMVFERQKQQQQQQTQFGLV